MDPRLFWTVVQAAQFWNQVAKVLNEMAKVTLAAGHPVQSKTLGVLVEYLLWLTQQMLDWLKAVQDSE